MQPLSEALADLSQRAKAAEDAFKASRTENKEKIDAQIDETRAAAERLRKQVQQNASAATDRMKSQWNDLQGRIAKTVERMRTDVEVRKQVFAADRAEARAELAEEEANAAVADASGAIEYARYAVLNAAAARRATHSDPSR
jgi:uncharacterized membrane-anchored protein YhcB (DUF1043 family)